MASGGGVTWFAKSMVEGLPVLIALGAGCALALLNLRKHPRASAWALGGGALLLLDFLLVRLWSAFAVAKLYASGSPNTFLLAGANFLFSLLMGAGIGLLFYAAFADREA